jgi:predicted nucleic acid-binding protein
MTALVDTPVWSFGFRRQQDNAHMPEVQALKQLAASGEALMLGAVRQEVLAGVRDEAMFVNLRAALRSFADVPLTVDDYEFAAECYTLCKRAGVQGSNTDFLLCAAAVRRDVPILTTDRDFQHYSKILPIRFYV